MKRERWYENKKITPEKLELARLILEDVGGGMDVLKSMQRHPMAEGGYIGKQVLVAAYRDLVESGEWEADESVMSRIRMKPVRSLSGVTVVTVLTKPYPCPGKCIFCPDDVRMPKSYLPDEPGAARAFQNDFDPYLQVSSRLEALNAVGHPTDKIELLILGGTWSVYPRDYQSRFIQRCLDALNGRDSADLEEAKQINESTAHRNVGLVIETRPDEINPEELAWLRNLGVTKVQMGVQSLDEEILRRNLRGHTVLDSIRACALLRAAGFKIVLHWMPNMLGATTASDREDFSRLWLSANQGWGLNPDEIKIYPTQLLVNTALHESWRGGGYQPYSTDELIQLIADIKPGVPEYCRINRVIRDIPSSHVVEGNRRTSLREDVRAELKKRGQSCRCIRCREVRKKMVSPDELQLNDRVYDAACAEEHFLSYDTPDGALAGYLRLSLPVAEENVPAALRAKGWIDFADLRGAAIIREVHIFGQSLPVGEELAGAAQHSGLGTSLLARAEQIARQHGFRRLAVISAIGTQSYYAGRGFQPGDLYMYKDL